MTRTGRIGAGLDGLNFFLADVRDGLGPYLAIYLLTVQHWDEAKIGVVMTVMGVATVAAQTPAGAFIDWTRWKRAVVVVAAAVISAACVIITLAPTFWAVAACKALMGAMAAVFPPAIAAITLGVMGPKVFTRRVGRNEAFNHAGNVTAAALAGLIGWLVSPTAVFYMVSAFGLGSIVSVLAIPKTAIDHDQARGLRPDDGADAGHNPSGFRALLECRPLLVFAACVTLFHFANAAMLPMVGEKLALANRGAGTAYMSACIIAAQVVMVAMAMLVGRKADDWGRKPIFLAAFAVLPIRGLLYTLSDDRFWLVGVQALDGVGAGIFGALFPLVVADLTRGTGRFNVSQGAIATAQGIGAAVSTSFAGFLQVRYGYHTAFLSLAGIAALGFLLFLVAMPETRQSAAAQPIPGERDIGGSGMPPRRRSAEA
jgi:MFS family permease